MKKIIPVLALIFLISCSQDLIIEKKTLILESANNSIQINVEIADEEPEWEQGLMLRQHLDEKSGMLFIFDKEEPQVFWMKDTLIPLDIIFIDKNFEIINIEYAVPCIKNPCPLYKSKKPAKYVLETKINFTLRNGIKSGNKIKIN